MSAFPPAPETAPAQWYRGDRLWPLERERVFAKAWNFFTHESSLPEPGSYVADIIAGYPLVVVRNEAGALAGFHNVCRHRAGPLTDARAGQCAENRLVCRYHGWRYAFDGRLANARDFGSAEGFDPRDYALFPIRVETWRGLVFVNLDLAAAPLAELMAPVDARLGEIDWSDLKISTTRHHPLECNWKTYVENYLEGYHIPNMHPSLDAEIDCSKYQVIVEGPIAFHMVTSRDPQGVYDGLFAWLWPNLAINVYRTGLMLERMSPTGPRGVQLDYFYMMPGGAPVADATMTMSDVVTGEDKWIVERVQENLDAGIYQTGRLSPRHEMAVAAFQDMVRAALGEAGA